MKKLKDRIGGLILLLLSLLLTVGTELIFPACGAHDDGTFMNCHWAQQSVFGTGAALCVMSVTVLAAGRGKTALGASLAMIPAAAAAALTPDVLIPLCRMPMMQCQKVMHPAIIVVSLLILLAAALNSAVLIRRKEKNA